MKTWLAVAVLLAVSACSAEAPPIEPGQPAKATEPACESMELKIALASVHHEGSWWKTIRLDDAQKAVLIEDFNRFAIEAHDDLVPAEVDTIYVSYLIHEGHTVGAQVVFAAGDCYVDDYSVEIKHLEAVLGKGT